ncbi:HD domain-containing phosphohydrolase [Deinococcus sp. Leaf326]|uniref:HD domain-containing phosphohydrolase n=1 Tax=Deinococcus sp. Leaf326 TaxID=1736338 RepID=UPI0009E8C23C|nr:HD domain-containing phosphohydrolase [Deinococcus sp. Leaf326]
MDTFTSSPLQRPPSKPALDAAALVHLARSSRHVFPRCVELALTTTRATTVLATLYRANLQVMEIVAAAGHLADRALGQTSVPETSLAWQVFQSGQALLLDDARPRRDAMFISGTPQPGMYLGVPLLGPDGQAFGVLSVDTTNTYERLGEEDREALTLLSQAAGVAYTRLLALEEAQRSTHRFERLAQLSTELDAIEQVPELYRRALGTLMELSGCALGVQFGLLDCGELSADLAILSGDSGVTETRISDVSAAFGVHAHTVAETGRSLSLSGQTDLSLKSDFQELELSVLSMAPLKVGGQVAGIVTLSNAGPVAQEAAEILRILEIVTGWIGRAAERITHIEHLRQMQEAALKTLGRVLEYRDDEVSGHTDRVTVLALRLGETLRLGPEDLQYLRWGAYLHDIGKVAVPDAILRKPGALTVQERAVMQRHVEVGDELLQDETLMPPAIRQIVRHHHERWDGRGYPDGLAGEAIPLLARVFSIVDVYDALISERPYKAAWTREAALAEVARGAGAHFDPRLVQVFLAMMAQDRQVRA